MELTTEKHEVLNLIAQGDEIILRVAKDIVWELSCNGFIVSGADGYELTPKGHEAINPKFHPTK